MPRLLLEYSPDLRGVIDPVKLLQQLSQAACRVPSVESSQVKARCCCPEQGWVGAREQERGYLFVLFEWFEGRSEKQRRQLIDELCDALQSLKPLPISVTLQVRTIPREEHVSIQ